MMSSDANRAGTTYFWPTWKCDRSNSSNAPSGGAAVSWIRSASSSVLFSVKKLPQPVINARQKQDACLIWARAPYGQSHVDQQTSSAGIRLAEGWGRFALARDRTISRRADQGHYRRPGRAECLLHRRGERRRLEDHRFRPHMAADLRLSADRLDRRDRRRAFRSEHRL